MEVVGPSMRLWAGTLIHAFFATGQVILAGVAYYVRDWRDLELYLALPNAIYLTYYWYLLSIPLLIFYIFNFKLLDHCLNG